MTESKFTSGPWEIDWPAVAALGKYERVLIGADGRNGGIYVAHAFGPHREANAHLIASAPDLFEALEVFARYGKVLLEKFPGNDGYALELGSDVAVEIRRDDFKKTIDALAKARGESK